MPCSANPPTASDQTPPGADSSYFDLTVALIALPTERLDLVEQLFDDLQTELAPTSALGRLLALRVALMAVRLNRSAVHEAKVLAHRMRHAVGEFDEARLAEVDELVAWILRHPETNSRRLRAMPEGVDRLIREIQGLRDDLAHPHGHRWGFDHADRLLSLTGRRFSDVPVHRVKALTRAIDGDFQHLEAAEGEGRDPQGRRLWALTELVYLMDAEIASLKALRGGMDLEGLELDRQEAAARAMFDGSKEGVLAKKYEAANERSMLRALREFREVKAQFPPPEPDPPQPLEPEAADELGSFFPGRPGEEVGSTEIDPMRVGRTSSGPILAVGVAWDGPGGGPIDDPAG